MGLEALFPGPRTTTAAPDARAYPYLLRDRVLTRVDEVWSSDITYVPMRHGFMYLTAVIDWYSRYVLSWRLSNTLDGGFCLEALDEALSRGQPEIFNTDQGSQFTSREYTGRLEEAGVAVSRDGRGRALDNVFVERLWRSVKYEDIYLKDYEQMPELETGLTAYFRFYDEDRPHQSLDYRTPGEVYRAGTRARRRGEDHNKYRPPGLSRIWGPPQSEIHRHFGSPITSWRIPAELAIAPFLISTSWSGRPHLIHLQKEAEEVSSRIQAQLRAEQSAELAHFTVLDLIDKYLWKCGLVRHRRPGTWKHLERCKR